MKSSYPCLNYLTTEEYLLELAVKLKYPSKFLKEVSSVLNSMINIKGKEYKNCNPQRLKTFF